MNKLRRAAASCLAAITAAAGISITAATADTVVLTFSCGGIWTPLHTRSTELTVTAPTTAAPGQTVTVTVNRLVDRSNTASEPIAADTRPGQVRLALGGSASGLIETGRMPNPAIATGEHWRVQNGTVQVTMPNSGEVTYSPSKWQLYPYPGWYCWPKSGEPTPIAARTRVQ
jgi:hypothetical protein